MLLDSDITRLTSNGELEINLQPIHPFCLYYKPWDVGLDVYQYDKHGQIDVYRVDPGIPILTQAGRKGAGPALRQFVSGIPECYRVSAVQFVHNQTLLLQWAARYPAARDLLGNNPILLWLLVDIAQRRYWQVHYIEKVLRARQADIVGEIVGLASKPAVKYLRKLVLKRGDRRELGVIMWSLKQGWFLECTRQLSVIPVHVVAVLYRSPQLATGRMVQSIAESLPGDIDVVRAMSEASRIRQVWGDTVRLGNTLGIRETQRVLANCRSLQHLEQLHTRWTRLLNRRDIARMKSFKFPTPPVPGTETIIPITSSAGLLEEGREMQHCVGSYSQKVQARQCYIYKVLEPQRATVELLITGNHVRIGEFRTCRDGPPSEECRKVVLEWLIEPGDERVTALTR